MKPITKFFIVGVSLVFFGCTSTVEIQKPPPDNATLEVKTTILEPWPDNKVEFHKAMYFATMAMRPDLRMRYQPHNLFNICACLVDILQASYTYDEFLKKFTGQSNLAPDAQQEIYNISYKCSQEEVLFMQQQLMVPDAKDAI